jgi:hypothetical protein
MAMRVYQAVVMAKDWCGRSFFHDSKFLFDAVIPETGMKGKNQSIYGRLVQCLLTLKEYFFKTDASEQLPIGE